MSGLTASKMTLNPKVTCHQCGDTFPDWSSLAVHVMSSKKTHKNKANRIWAANYLNRKLLQQKAEIKHAANDPDKEKTEIGEENRQNMKRRLSGENSFVNAVCPKCHKKHAVTLECEYVKSPSAWRIGDKLVKLCGGCTR